MTSPRRGNSSPSARGRVGALRGRPLLRRDELRHVRAPHGAGRHRSGAGRRGDRPASPSGPRPPPSSTTTASPSSWTSSRTHSASIPSASRRRSHRARARSCPSISTACPPTWSRSWTLRDGTICRSSKMPARPMAASIGTESGQPGRGSGVQHPDVEAADDGERGRPLRHGRRADLPTRPALALLRRARRAGPGARGAGV